MQSISKNHKSFTEQYREIHYNVTILEFSEDSFLEIINLINKAILIAQEQKSKENNNTCLSQLKMTKEKELEIMKSKYGNIEEEKHYFNILKENFLLDLSCFCY